MLEGSIIIKGSIIIISLVIAGKILAILLFKQLVIKNSLIRQHGISDCGAACIASVSEHYGLKIPFSIIRQLASTNKKGTNVLGLVEAATRLGFTAKGVKGPYESLFKIPLPAIAHVIIKERVYHYVVIYGIDKKHITIMDPAYGRISHKNHEEFKLGWTGKLVILLPDEGFKKEDKSIPVFSKFFHLLSPHKNIIG